MNSAPIATPSPAVSGPGQLNAPGYALHSDLAQYCLPAANRDVHRKLAYVNSICSLFVLIGIAGINPPVLEQKVPEPVQQFIPVEIVQPPEPPKTEPQPQEQNPEPQPDTPVVMPQIATVVAADPTQVKFAVPVEGPVMFAPAKFAQAPPPAPPKSTGSKIIKFTGTDGGTYPHLDYPAWARRQDQGIQEANATFLLVVNPDGSVASVEVQNYSGSYRLVKFAAEWIKNRYKFPPIETGEMRRYEKPVEFKL